jgi:hypothetical protein
MISIHRFFLVLVFNVFAAGSLISRVAAQAPPEFFSEPPKSFSAEDATFPNAIPLPECARRLLAQDTKTAGPLKYEAMSPEELPEDWFTASEETLGQGSEKLLVVMGAKMMRGANINPFWIFRRSGQTCKVILSVAAHNLVVLKRRTNGLPDIQIGGSTAVTLFESWYEFDGESYRRARTLTQPIGYEVPQDLSGFETRPPLIQTVSQDPSALLSKARDWLWRHWHSQKPSYLKVILHSKEGDETTTTYFLERGADGPIIAVQIHSVSVDRAPHSGPRKTVVEDEILVATSIERRWAIAGNPDRKSRVPDSQDASPDSYELFLNDDHGNNLDVL